MIHVTNHPSTPLFTLWESAFQDKIYPMYPYQIAKSVLRLTHEEVTYSQSYFRICHVSIDLSLTQNQVNIESCFPMTKPPEVYATAYSAQTTRSRSITHHPAIIAQRSFPTFVTQRFLLRSALLARCEASRVEWHSEIHCGRCCVEGYGIWLIPYTTSRL